MEMKAATTTACSDDNGGGDDNNDNGAITMVINLDLRTAGVRRYVARLNLTGGMSSSRGATAATAAAAGEAKMRMTTRMTRCLPHRWGRWGNGQRVPQELLALCPLFPPCGSAVIGGGRRR